MEDKFEEFEEEFEAKSAWYQVWCLGYDEDQNITDWDCFVDESHDPDKMIERAKAFIAGKQYEGLNVPENVAYLEVLVETVVDCGEDGTRNVGNLFQEVLPLF